ncbi:MAG: hypothetical protein V3T64_15860 [Myxococcota bacterium]
MHGASAYYEHSGRFTITGLVSMLAGAAVAAPVVGYAYGYLVAINPFIYVNFLATLRAGCGVGIAVGQAAKWGQTRNFAVAGVMGAFAGAALLYVQWSATLAYYETEPSLGEPLLMWEQITMLASLERWTIFGVSPGSWGFAAIWGIEGLMLMSGATLLSIGLLDEPYCERCRQWTEVDQVVEPFDYVTGVEHLSARLDRGDVDVLKAFEKIEVSRRRYSQLELINCSSCHDLRIVNIKNIEIKLDRDEGEEKRDSVVVSHILVDASTYEAIKKS